MTAPDGVAARAAAMEAAPYAPESLRERVAAALNDTVARRNEAREPSLPTARWDDQTAYVRQLFRELADEAIRVITTQAGDAE